jgi:hypothetical protein
LAIIGRAEPKVTIERGQNTRGRNRRRDLEGVTGAELITEEQGLSLSIGRLIQVVHAVLNLHVILELTPEALLLVCRD